MPKTVTIYRIIQVETQLFVQGEWETKHAAGRAKIALSEYDFDFLGDSDYRVIPVVEIASQLLNPPT